MRNVPFSGTGNGVYNSDLAFKDNLVVAGTYEGFRILDVTNPSNPIQKVNYTGCNVGQGDVIVYGNLVIRSWDAEASASSTCAGQLVGQGFEGIHIFDISNPSEPQFIRALRFADNGMTEVRCRTKAAARTPRPPCRTRPAASSTSTTVARAATAGHRHLPDQPHQSDLQPAMSS